ncbi:viroplasmin family protein [Clostridium celatum]|uniref:ribonuclease H1 domain-containing protein n=1 Tax=Clostridium celatum TaxID=36834 RepID=UPI001898F865|nr:ribonuclease H family protein [Clostridium celatum]MDU6294847.1 ribonuclease H family protein [Clostridium celatum]
MKILKYYAVYRGKSGAPKIFTSWDECKKEVIGFKGAIYKSFTSEKEAINFIALNSEGKSTGSDIVEENEEGLFIYVDGSFSVEKGNYSFGLVAVLDGKIIHEDKGQGFDSEAVALRNVSGEVLGAKMAVEFAINKGYKEVTIAYDYQGVESWALGTWKRNNRITSEYHEFMQNRMKDIKIKFKKIKGHSGDKFNDMADKLAKEALGIS